MKRAHEPEQKQKSGTLMLVAGAGLVVAIAACVLAVINLAGGEQHKTAFVRSGKIFLEFRGMKEAQSMLEGKMQVWQSNVDTLKADFQRALEQYRSEASNLSMEQRKEREQELGRQENNLRQYTQTVQGQAREEENSLTGGVLKQVNSFIEDYGKKHGYTYIFGTTNDGSILYGEESHDITEEVLRALNAAYDSGQLPAPADSTDGPD